MAKVLFLRFQINEINLSWAKIKLQKLYILLLLFEGIENVLTKTTDKPYFQTLDFSAKLSIDIGLGVVSIISPIIWYLILSLVMKGLHEIRTHEKLF